MNTYIKIVCRNMTGIAKINGEFKHSDLTSYIISIMNVEEIIWKGKFDESRINREIINGVLRLQNPVKIKMICRGVYNNIKRKWSKDTFTVYTNVPPKMFISNKSKPDHIIFEPQAPYTKHTLYRMVDFSFGSFPLSETHYFKNTEKEFIPLPEIGDYEFIPEESTVTKSIYKLKWRNK